MRSQRWLTCPNCGAAGPRDSSSARAILANDRWAVSFENAKLAQEQGAANSAGGRAVKAAWERLQAVMDEAKEGVCSEDRSLDWHWPADAWRNNILQQLNAAEEALERVLKLTPKQRAARPHLIPTPSYLRRQ